MYYLYLLVVAWICVLSLSCAVATVESGDDFQAGRLDSTRWQRTENGDFKEATVDVLDVDSEGGGDYWLRLRTDTIGTQDDTVKFLGVRSVSQANFAKGVVVSFDLDWNKQANGCYLSAALYLCPTITSTNPKDEADWFKLEDVGVPPGKNVRSIVARKVDGTVRYLDKDGWPEDRHGRQVANQHINLLIDSDKVCVRENGRELYSTSSHGLPFKRAYLYLQMSSHSNYPAREVYFDNISILKNHTTFTIDHEEIADQYDHWPNSTARLFTR